MNKRPVYSPEVRERAVGLVLTSEHEHSSRWAAIQSVATKMGCTPETLRSWINKMEVDTGAKPGVTSAQSKRMKALERENRELRRSGVSAPGGTLNFATTLSVCGKRVTGTTVLVKSGNSLAVRLYPRPVARLND